MAASAKVAAPSTETSTVRVAASAGCSTAMVSVSSSIVRPIGSGRVHGRRRRRPSACADSTPPAVSTDGHVGQHEPGQVAQSGRQRAGQVGAADQAGDLADAGDGDAGAVRARAR